MVKGRNRAMCSAREVLHDVTIGKIASAHRKTPAHVMLRSHLQQGRQAIPKSVTPSRTENNGIFDFELTAEDLVVIDARDTGIRGGPDPKVCTTSMIEEACTRT